MLRKISQKKRINTLKKKKMQGLKFLGFVAKLPTEVPKIDKILPSHQNEDRKFKRICHSEKGAGGGENHDVEFKPYQEKTDDFPVQEASNRAQKHKFPQWSPKKKYFNEDESHGRDLVIYDDFDLFE